MCYLRTIPFNQQNHSKVIKNPRYVKEIHYVPELGCSHDYLCLSIYLKTISVTVHGTTVEYTIPAYAKTQGMELQLCHSMSPVKQALESCLLSDARSKTHISEPEPYQ